MELGVGKSIQRNFSAAQYAERASVLTMTYSKERPSRFISVLPVPRTLNPDAGHIST